MSVLDRRPRAVDLGLLVLWAVLIGLVRASRPDETDPYWQIRDGMELLDGRPLSVPDTWGWDPVPGDYFPNSPLWNVILAVAWRLGGFPGFVAVTVLVIVAYFLVAAWTATLAGARRVPFVIAVLVVSILALPALSPRATVVAQVLLLGSINVAVEIGRRARRWHPWAAAGTALVVALLFSAVGNWLHVSWGTAAALMVVAWAVIWLVMPGPGSRLALVMAGAGVVGAVIGVALGPYGWSVRERSSVVLESSRNLITEWSPIWHPGQFPPLVISAVLAVLAAALLAIVCARRLNRGLPRSVPVAVLCAITVVAVPAAVAGLLYLRFAMVAWLTLLPACAAGLTGTMDRLHARTAGVGAGFWRSRLALWSSDGPWRVVLWATGLLMLPLAVIYAAPMGRPTSLAALDDLPTGCQLFTQSAESAAVILLRPDVPIWMDGRADYWGRQRIVDYNAFTVAQDPATLVPDGTTCVMLQVGPSGDATRPLAQAMDTDARWERAGGADGYVVWLPSTSKGS